MDLFNAKFDERKVGVLKKQIQIFLYTRTGSCYFQGFYNKNFLFFQDTELNRWAYSNYRWEIKVPGYYCKDIPIGIHKIPGEEGLYIRVETPEEVLKKAEDYFLPLAIKEKSHEGMLNLKKMNTDFSSN